MSSTQSRRRFLQTCRCALIIFFAAASGDVKKDSYDAIVVDE